MALIQRPQHQVRPNQHLLLAAAAPAAEIQVVSQTLNMARFSTVTHLLSFPVLLVGISIAIMARRSEPQRPVGTTLPPPTARLDEEFTRIVGLRELRDGRVVVADADDKRLVVADFSKNLVAQIGREGRGPGEYAQITGLTALGPDSTLVPDRANGRWLLLVRDQIAQTLPPQHPAVRAARGLLRGTDGRGYALITTAPPIRAGTQSLGKDDSIAAVLVTLATGATDTVAKLRTAPLAIWTELDGSGKVTRAGLTYPPFSVGEEPLLFPDGWLAVARLDPYRVDWRTPSGRWIRGAPLPFAERAVDERERQAYLARRTTVVGRAQAAPPRDSWPSTVPPFQPSPLIALPDRTLLILRTPTADQPGHRYDHINRLGYLVGWLELPATDRLVGIGALGAYVATTDARGVQFLQRHPWP